MALCNLCHTEGGHTETCPHLIRVAWSTGAHLWESLAKELYEEWKQTTVVYDRGTSKDQQLYEGVTEIMDDAIERLDVHTALETLRAYRNRSKYRA